MGQIIGRLWGPQSHSELTTPPYFAGWLNVCQRDIQFTDDGTSSQITRTEAGGMGGGNGGETCTTHNHLMIDPSLPPQSASSRVTRGVVPSSSDGFMFEGRSGSRTSLSNKPPHHAVSGANIIEHFGGEAHHAYQESELTARVNQQASTSQNIRLSPDEHRRDQQSKREHTNSDLILQSCSASQEQSAQTRKSQRTEIWTQKLQYVVLTGDRIQFYSIEVEALNQLQQYNQGYQASPNHQYIIYRKNGIVEINEIEQSFTLFMQDVTAKLKQKKLKFICTLKSSFLKWIEEIKKTQRPKWSDPEVLNCYICEQKFSFFKRQHHCRKCGTAVCNECSNYKISIPDLSYFNRVRVCRGCMEAMQQRNVIQRDKNNEFQNILLPRLINQRIYSQFKNFRGIMKRDHFCQVCQQFPIIVQPRIAQSIIMSIQFRRLLLQK